MDDDKKPQRKLTYEQTINLSKWLEASRHRIETGDSSIVQLAEQASKDLEFEVGFHSIQSVADVVAVKLPTANRRVAKDEKVAELAKVVDGLLASYSSIETAFNVLSDRLDAIELRLRQPPRLFGEEDAS